MATRPRQSAAPGTESRRSSPEPEGWQGWDEYAPFYDWENARTLGRRDVPFWRGVAARADGPVLELGCGTGRVSIPLARAGVDLVGVDRSMPMLSRARLRSRRASGGGAGVRFVRGDIRTLPFEDARFAMVLAPYGILQSLVRERDLAATLESVARVLEPGGLFGLDLVPDVPNWREYRNKIQMRGRARGGHLTLVESVRQDPKRHLTIFDQEYIQRRGSQVARHRFSLTFRTLSVPQMTRRLERAGFAIESVLGDYRGRPWDERADVWIVLARRIS
jgi:ubiquinone/menaquinone biosynthesis C-methylase UbiE